MFKGAETTLYFIGFVFTLLFFVVVHTNDKGNVVLHFIFRDRVITQDSYSFLFNLLNRLVKEKRIEPGAAFDTNSFFQNSNFASYMKPIDHNSLTNERELSMSERRTVNTFYSREFEHKFIPRIKFQRKEYLFQRGFLYDHIRIPHPWPVGVKWFQKNQNHSVFTSILEDESDWDRLSVPNRFDGW